MCASDNKKSIQNTILNKYVFDYVPFFQVHTDIEGLVSKHQVAVPCTLGSKIAAGLSEIYLPPLPPPVDTYIPPRRREKTPIMPQPSSTLQESSVEVKSQQPKESKPMRTSLK